MTRAPEGADPRAFLERVGPAPARLLLLDYDGTLAPFREARDEATPYPGVREALADILEAGTTRVVVVSGRAVSDLEPLLGLDPMPELWGTHGWERKAPGGAVERLPAGPEVEAALVEGRAAAEGVAADAGLDDAVEVKPAAVAVHHRGLGAAERDALGDALRAAWEPFSDRDDVAVEPFDGGLELRATGRDKGTAVREILADAPSESVVAYLGDDRTDEDAFAAVAELVPRGHRLTLLVRPLQRETGADAWIRPPEALVEWLQAWSEAERAGDDEPPAGEGGVGP